MITKYSTLLEIEFLTEVEKSVLQSHKEMGLESVLLQLEHIATNRSRNHHSTHLAIDGWSGGYDFGL